MRGADEKIYSWWSYRNRDWRVSNRGRRLDHVWMTKGLEKILAAVEILDTTRDWVRPSDHCPVAVSLKV